MSQGKEKDKDKTSKEEVDKDTAYLRGYGLPEDEVVTDAYQCAIHLSPINKPAGKLYLTKNYLCFVGQKKLVGGDTVKSWFVREILDISPVGRTAIKISGLSTKPSVIGNFASEETRDKILRSLKRLLYGINGGNALHKAVMSSETDTVRQICELDCSKLSEYNTNEQTPLILACIAKNDVEMVEYFLEVYKKNTEKLDINQTDERGGLHLLHEVCKSSDISDAILKKLLEFPGLKVNSKVKIDNNTPLHYFCERNHSLSCETVGKIFIEKGADVNSQNAQHETPLHRAILNTSVRKFMVKLLLANKASVDIKAGNSGDLPLHYAVRVASVEVLKLLLEAGADFTLKNNDGEDPLSLAQRIANQAQGAGGEAVVEFLNQVSKLYAILKKADLHDLLGKFMNHGLYDTKLLCQMDEDKLHNLGVEKMGPRMRLIREIQDLKEQQEQERKEIRQREAYEKQKKEQFNAIVNNVKDSARGDSGGANEIRQELGVEYEIDEKDIEYLEELGKGASGEVFLGLYKKQKVAIKVLHTQNQGEEAQDFKKEFQILVKVKLLKSDYIITFFGVVYEPRLCMIMEFAENGSLHSVLNKPSVKFTWDRLLTFSYDTARGLEALHTLDPPIVHRDLKSLNLLVTSDWRVKVCDFGLSRSDSPDQLVTLYRLCGTCAYCAPEMFLGKKCTPKSDVYSMGIVIWEMVMVVMTGKYSVPFSELDLNHQFQILVEASKGFRPTLPAGAPIDVVELYNSCVLPEPEDRPTATEVAKRILKIQTSYKENPSNWANKKKSKAFTSTGNSDSDAASSTLSRSRDDSSTASDVSDRRSSTRDDLTLKSRMDLVSRSREDIASGRKTSKKTDRASTNGSSTPHTPSSERTRAAKAKAKSDVIADASSVSDEESGGEEDDGAGSSGSSNEGTDSNEEKPKKPKQTPNKTKKKQKKREIPTEDTDDSIGGSAYDGGKTSRIVREMMKERKEREKEDKEEKKEKRKEDKEEEKEKRKEKEKEDKEEKKKDRKEDVKDKDDISLISANKRRSTLVKKDSEDKTRKDTTKKTKS